MEMLTTSEVLVVKDQDGNVLLEAPIVEFHQFTMLNLIELQESGQELSYMEIAKHQTEKVNAYFKANITWPHLLQVAEFVNNRIEELKKNNSLTVAG